ncbi:MAG TPA: hypothetical protein VHX12_04335 [Acidisoma sp.]|jgi:hypothetical protein|nr:hypothetical protein [Acidisoma sp.]
MKSYFAHRRGIAVSIACALAVVMAGSAAVASAASDHPASARIAAYLMASQQEEIALARSAAPASVSAHAAVMVLTAHGYITAAKGNNGFVCIVTRSWDNTAAVASGRFWDPKTRVPYCVNAAGARSMLAEYLMKSQWVLAGASKAEIGKRVKAARTMGNMAGSICYMMSKRSWGVAGRPGAWRPHLMFYFSNSQAPNWGADMDGIPIYSGPADDDTTTYSVLVPVWSDGSPAPGF